jgi:hypothetical protein
MTGSGGTSTDEFGREFDQAVSDPDVSAILINVDSAGRVARWRVANCVRGATPAGMRSLMTASPQPV